MENINNTEATEATTPAVELENFTVLVGVEVECKSANKWDAIKDAQDLFNGLTKEVNLGEHRPNALVTHKGYSSALVTLPEGMTAFEAYKLLEWARETADRSAIDYDELTEELETLDKWNLVRGSLAGVPVRVFAQWLQDGNGTDFTFRYQLTEAEVLANAEACAEQYLGQGSREEFTANYYEETGALSGVPSELVEAIDWDSVWYSSMQYDTNEVEDFETGETYFFRNY